MAGGVMARFKRLDGYDVHFLTGTDEHGQKVQKSAAAAGTDPKSFTDRVSQSFRDLAAALGASCDDFIRTTEQRHIEACQAIWKAIEAKGDIYLGSYSGWYSVRDRKSVVSGKRVSVRVDLGGRRIIKKKQRILTNKTK